MASVLMTEPTWAEMARRYYINPIMWLLLIPRWPATWRDTDLVGVRGLGPESRVLSEFSRRTTGSFRRDTNRKPT